MQEYFKKVIEAAQDYVNELGSTRKKWESEIIIAKQSLDAGDITDKGYNSVLNDAKTAKASLDTMLDRVLNTIKLEFNSAIDDYMCPKAEMLDASMVELLDRIPLTASEFIKCADKYRGNPTMERLLVRHKVANKIEVNWSPESSAKIKQTFDNLIVGTVSAAHMEKIDHVKYLASKAYHTLRDSDDNVLPIPERPADYTDSFTDGMLNTKVTTVVY